jgi:cellulose biosynthesis protein BcsQ
MSMFKIFSKRGRQASAEQTNKDPGALQDVHHLYDTLALDATSYQKFEPRPLPEPSKALQQSDELTPPLAEEVSSPPSLGETPNQSVPDQSQPYSVTDDVQVWQREVAEKTNQESRYKWVTQLQSDWTRIASKDALVVGFASYSGGVGKSTLCAALSSALHAQHYHCLVLGQTHFSPLPFYLGVQNPLDADTEEATTQYVLAPSQASGSLNLVIANRMELDLVSQARLNQARADLILYDLESSSEIASAFESLDLLLVPVRPDINGLIIINRIEQAVSDLSSPPALGVYYVLNQYDESKPIHREIRSALRKRVGERLLDIVVPFDVSVQEALACGALPETYRSDAPFVDAIHRLGLWLRDVARLPKRT